MVTPAVLRLETEEQVVLEAPGLNAAAEATLLVQDFPLKRHVIYQIRVPLRPDNGMLATTTIKVCHHPRVTSLQATALSSPGRGDPWGSDYMRWLRISQGLVGPGGACHHGVFGDGRPEVLGGSHPRSLGTMTLGSLEMVTL